MGRKPACTIHTFARVGWMGSSAIGLRPSRRARVGRRFRPIAPADGVHQRRSRVADGPCRPLRFTAHSRINPVPRGVGFGEATRFGRLALARSSFRFAQADGRVHGCRPSSVPAFGFPARRVRPACGGDYRRADDAPWMCPGPGTRHDGNQAPRLACAAGDLASPWPLARRTDRRGL